MRSTPATQHSLHPAPPAHPGSRHANTSVREACGLTQTDDQAPRDARSLRLTRREEKPLSHQALGGHHYPPERLRLGPLPRKSSEAGPAPPLPPHSACQPEPLPVSQHHRHPATSSSLPAWGTAPGNSRQPVLTEEKTHLGSCPAEPHKVVAILQDGQATPQSRRI
ncbi:hypothetical protein NDU88_000767 [Pleurodeles waltl]|uniref:Uncharacterized protein n=1 Tax=Pleurodeles waltl TaxID=8319 RepID=A0AAV7L7T0_PLEWA|nr:hypothetical protein NDU88_000767 [Pleurodeles waltl]